MELEPETGHDAEVAATAADRPEQIGFVPGIDDADLPVGGDNLGTEERVDGQPMLAHEIADATAGHDAAEAHGAGVPEPDGEAVLIGRCRELACG